MVAWSATASNNQTDGPRAEVEMIGDKATEAGITAKTVEIAGTAGIVARAGIVETTGTVEMVVGIAAMAGIVTVATVGSESIAVGGMIMTEVTTVDTTEAGIVDMGRGATIVAVGPANPATIDGRATTDTRTTVGMRIGGEVVIEEVVGIAEVAMVGITGMVPADGTTETVRTTDRTDDQGTTRGMGTGHVKTTDVTTAMNKRTNSGRQTGIN